MPNSLSQVPKGSLLQAQNTVVDYEGLLNVRRGLKQYGTSLADLTGVPNTEVFQEFFYKGSKLVWCGDSAADIDSPDRQFMAYDSDGLGTWALTTHPFPRPAYTLTDTYRYAQSNGNLYFTSINGILKTDAPANALYSAGGLPGLDGVATLIDMAGFMADSTQVAYRMTWTYTDANNNAVEGTPSTRLVIANTSGGDRNVQLVYTIPNGATTAYTWKIYRTRMSASDTTDPGDEEQQVLVGNPDGTDITNGYFTATDTVPESQLGAALYTNSGQQGIAQANNIPPLSNDMCFFFGYMIYGSCTTQQKFLLSLLSAETPLGIQVGDTLTVTNGPDNFTITGAVSEDISTNEFEVFTGGDPGSDIELTKESIIRVVNRIDQSLVYAYDASDVSSGVALPGDFYFQEQNIGGGVFSLTSSRSTCWSPALDPTTGSPSLAGGSIGAGYCSKFQQPEAVPVANTINAGNPNFEWLRCLPLRNSVIILKADGLFQLTGSTFPFTVTNMDTGTILTAPESAVILNNQVYAYTNQGVVAISETSPGIISRPIENIFQQISSYLYPNFPIATFGTSYETDRKYILNTISAEDDYHQATIQYVYDTITQAWTSYRYPVALWDLLESPTEQRLYGTSGSVQYPYVLQERKTFTVTDYADFEIPVTIVSYDNSNSLQYIVTLTDTSSVTPGWSLAQIVLGALGQQSQVLNLSVITQVLNATQIVVTDAINWDLSMLSFTAVEQPILVNVRYAPIVGNMGSGAGQSNPSIIKFFKEIQLFFQNVDFDFVTIRFGSDFVSGTPAINITPTTVSSGWGQFPWGQVPWGGSTDFSVQSIRTYIPLAVRRCHWLNLELSLNQAMTRFTYGGCVLQYTDVTTRSK